MIQSRHNKESRASRNLQTSRETSEYREFGSAYEMLDEIPSIEMLDELGESLLTVNTRNFRLAEGRRRQ